MERRVEATAFSSLSERDAARAFILREISASEDVIRSWKRQYNELSLISRLPGELLAVVFKCVRDSFPDDLRWIAPVSYVCTHWRNVALECPSLWSKIFFRNIWWAEEMLVRSKVAPLTIQLLGSTHYRENAAMERRMNTIVAAATQLHRITTLSLPYLHEKYMAPFAQALLNSPAPLLTSLTIYSPEFILPVNALQRFPLLQHLILQLFDFCDWESSSLGNLRTLMISLHHVNSERNLSNVLSALCRMSQLETLELCLTSAPSELDGPTAFLPRLRSLKLIGSARNCVILLSHIHFSNPSHICLELGPEEESTAFYLCRLSETLDLKIAEQWRIRSLVIGKSRIDMRTEPWDNITGGPGTLLSPRIEIQWSPSRPRSGSFLVHIIESLSLQCLKSLSVLDHSLLLAQSKEQWLDLFGDLACLDTIKIGPSDGFIEALNCIPIPAAECTIASEKYNVKFKALRSLYLDGWPLDSHWHHGKHHIRSWFQRITVSLASRKSGDMELKTLVLECRDVLDRYVDDLKKVVGEVEIGACYSRRVTA